MHPTATEVVVRPAREQDLDAIVELFVEVAAEGRWIGTEPPVDRDRRRRRLAETLDQEREGVLVAEGWRGRGVGSALLRAGIEWARGAGAHKVALQVWPHNAAALALYEKFGFQREGLLRGHYRRRNGELWDAIVMGLPL